MLTQTPYQFQSKGYNYGFVEYDDPGAAERAMQTLNGRRVHQQEIRVNWAYQSNNTSKEDTSNHFHIFVGDLSNEVNDEVLLQAFSAFGNVSEARVMWDMKTGRSRGYGFVAFRDRGDAEKALSAMDGEWLGSRAIRCNWANQKGQPSFSQQQAMAQMGMTPTTPYGHHSFPTQGAQSYEMVVQQTPQWQTTCYVGNLTPYTTQNDLVPLFQNFGYVTETRFQSDRGFAFVKMDTHENAAMAICQLSGYQVNGRPLKCSVSYITSFTSPTSICLIIVTVGQRSSTHRPIRRPNPANPLRPPTRPRRLSTHPSNLLSPIRRCSRPHVSRYRSFSRRPVRHPGHLRRSPIPWPADSTPWPAAHASLPPTSAHDSSERWWLRHGCSGRLSQCPCASRRAAECGSLRWQGRLRRVPGLETLGICLKTPEVSRRRRDTKW